MTPSPLSEPARDWAPRSLAVSGPRASPPAASVRDPQALVTALDQVTGELGPIEVLEYSPLPQKEFLRPVLAVLADKLWHLHTHPGRFRVFAEELPAES